MLSKAYGSYAGLLAVAFTAIMFGSGAAAQAKKDPVKITYQQAFAPSVAEAPMYVAIHKGFFAEEGIDVKLQRSQDPANAVSLVGVGEAQFGRSYPPDVMLAIEKGMPLKAIWADFQENPFGIVSLANGANIRSPKDLAGKRIGLTSLPIDQLQFNAMLEKEGVSRRDVEVFNPGFSGGDLVSEKKLDGASGVPWYEVDGLKAKGMEPQMMLYRDYTGLDFPFMVTIVNGNYMEQNPDVVRAYLRALRKGADYTKEHPEEALEIVLKAVPALDRKRQTVAMETLGPLRESRNTAEHGFGYLDIAQLQSLADFLHQREALRSPLKVDQFFTNEYREP